MDGSRVGVSFEELATQGVKPVTAVHPTAMTAAVEQTVRKSISADSFKKLTALLKKPLIIPDVVPDTVLPAQLPPHIEIIAEKPIVSQAPIISEIEPIVPEPVAKVIAIEAIQPEPAPRIVAIEAVPHVVPIEPALEILAIEPTPQVVAIEPVAIKPSLQIQAIEPIAIEPVAAAVPIIAEIVPTVIEPEPIAQVLEPIAEIVKPVVKKIERSQPRDAFALPPSALIKPRAPAAIVPAVQTPQQEQESAELARSLLDMMASGASSGLPQERALAADTLLRMLPRLPLKSLIMLAERLCMMDQPPQLLVAKLICDSRIEIAGPLLEECMHITDEDLAMVIHDGTTAKNRMIARRRRISRAISSQLIRTEEPSVLLTLARNVGAEIPHESFADFVELATKQTELLAPLCIRPDLPVPYAFELFWPAPAQLRRYLLSRFLTDSETLTKILKITLDNGTEDVTTNDFPKLDDVKSALQLWYDGSHEEACSELADLAKINPGTAVKILSDHRGDALAALLKAVGFPRSNVAEVATTHLNIAEAMLDEPRDPEELQSLFDSLSFNKARILLTYWDWATTQSGPFAPLN
jgi:Uncharacterised protein conserved in bacteria (DUF2336)